jgi:type IX secretion system substrate protein
MNKYLFFLPATYAIPKINSFCLMLCKVICLSVWVFMSINANAQTNKIWAGINNNSWNNANNWFPNGVPGINDIVIIDNNNVVEPIIPNGVTAIAREVRVAGELDIYGILNLYPVQTNGISNFGVLTNEGIINIYGNSNIPNGNGIENYGGTIINDDVGTGGGPGEINITEMDEYGIYNRQGGFFYNKTGSIINMSQIGEDGIYNSSSDEFINDGEIWISDIGTTISSYGITNFDSFTNGSTGTIHINQTGGDGIYHGHNAVPFINEGEIWIGDTNTIGTQGITIHSNFINKATGIIHVNQTGDEGISMTSHLINKGQIWIGDTGTIGTEGIRSFDSLTNEVNGIIHINQTISHGIEFRGGTSLFSNEGQISIGDTGDIGVHGIITTDNSNFTNQSGGTINIGTASSPIGTYGIFNDSGCVFSNWGSIKVMNTSSAGIRNDGIIANNSGTIEIDQTGYVGIYNLTGDFSNDGTIAIGSIAAISDYGLTNTGTFNNNSGGTITIDRTADHGLWNFKGTFTNEGLIKIGEIGSIAGRALSNSDGWPDPVFLNSGCDAVIHIFKKAIQDPKNTFTNTGLIVQESTASSNIHTNNGIILYNAGTFIADNGETPVSVSGSFSGRKLWTGCTDPDWHTDNNWFPNGVPTLSDEVSIYPMTNVANISNTANAKVVRVLSGGNLTLQSGSILNLHPVSTEGIYNAGTLTSGGEINITRYNGNSNLQGIDNEGGTFISQSTGVLNINGVDEHGIRNRSNGSFTNQIGGTINIGTENSQIGDHGLFNESGSTFNNSGTLKVRNTATLKNGIENRGIFWNYPTGNIMVDQTGRWGFIQFTGATFNNLGNMTIGSLATINGDGLQNQGTFNNTSSGTITIDQVTRHGIYNYRGLFSNEGLIKIGEIGGIAERAIFNNDDNNGYNPFFLNSVCSATIQIFDKNISDPVNFFTNNGTILQESTGSSNINNNNGLILYNAGSFTVNMGNTPVSVSGTVSDKKIWKGCTNSDWDTANNWVFSDIPTATDDVFIYSSNNDPTIAGGTTAQSQSLTLESGATLTNSGSLTVATGNFEIKSSATGTGDGNYFLNGDFLVDAGGTFTPGTSTVTMTETGDHSIGSSAISFYNLEIDKPIDNKITVDGDVTVTNGLTVTSGDLEILGGKSLDCPQLQLPSDSDLTNNGSLTCSTGVFRIQSGASAQGNGQYFLNGNFELKTGGTFAPGTSTVTMTGAGNNAINNQAVSFYNLEIDNPAGIVVNLFTDVTVTNELTISSGNLILYNSHALTCPQIHLPSSSVLFNFGSITLTVGDLWIQSGANVDGSGQYFIAGDFLLDAGGIFIPGASTVTMNGGTNTLSHIGNAPVNFYNLVIDKSSVDYVVSLSVSGAITVTNELTMISGILDLNGKDIELTGNGTIIGESASSYIYSSGTGVVKKTVDLNAPTSENPGNIGVSITSSANLGSTIIQRGHEVQTVNGEASIVRYYDISPTNNSGLNATVQFSYLDHELNGGIVENDLIPFRYNGTTWDDYPVTANDVTANWVETNGVDAFSIWTLANSSSILPVELIHFSAEKRADEVLLRWQTATELNNEGFEVEHSTDGSNWEYLGFVNGNGNSTEKHDYNFTHKSPANGENYYRLLQVDFDGQSDYSDIRSVEFEILDSQINVFPNPATSHSNIQLPGEYDEAHIIVSDLNGRTIFTQRLEGGNPSHTLDVSSWQSGMYLIRIQLDGRFSTHKLQVIKD